MGVEVAIAAIGVAVAAAGAGVSYYGAQQQAESTERMAVYNQSIAEQNAVTNRAIARRQQEYQRMSIEQQQAQDVANANQRRAQADIAQQQGLEQQTRIQLEKQREIARQRAQYAAAGVLTTGSPLAVLANTAATLQLQASDVAYQTEQERRALTYEADTLDYAAKVEGSRKTLLEIEGVGTEQGYQIALQQAGQDAASARNQAAGIRLASTGQLLQSASSIATSGANIYGKLPSAK